MIRRFAIALLIVHAVVLALFSPTQSYAQDSALYPQIETRVEPTSGTIGDRFLLDLTVRVPQSNQLSALPLFETQTTWSLVEALPVPPPVKQDGVDVVTYRYLIAPFETGRVELPQVAFSYTSADSATSHTAHSEPQWIFIDSVLQSGAATDLALRDVKPPESMPIPTPVVVGGSILILLILAGIGYLLWRRYSASLRRLLSMQLRADQKALKQLSAIESEKLIEQKKIKEYYTRLADVLRHYISETFTVDAPDLTTNELLMELDGLAAGQPQRQADSYRTAVAKLSELLNEADLVKFARVQPEASHCRRALQNARDVVGLTRYTLESEDETSPPTQNHRIPPVSPSSDYPSANPAAMGSPNRGGDA